MKSLASYVGVGVVALVISTVFHFMLDQASGESDELGTVPPPFSHDDVRAAVAEVMSEHERDRVASGGTATGALLARLEHGMSDLERRQDELLKRLESVVQESRAPASGDEGIPDQARLEDLVAQAIVGYQEQAERERQERRERQRGEREARRRERSVQALTKKLGLDGRQQGEVTRLMEQLDEARATFFKEMRQARRSGSTTEWQTMRGNFARLRDEADSSLRALLNAEQDRLYDEYKKENPLGFWAGGRDVRVLRGGRSDGGGRGGGGRGGGRRQERR